MTIARCMKCRDQKEMIKEYETITKNGLICIRGKCPDCDTNMSRIKGKSKNDKKTIKSNDGDENDD